MQMAYPRRTTSRSRLNLKNCKHTITIRVEKGMKKWGISLLGEMPHFIILVILFAANLLNGRIKGRIRYRSILAVMLLNHHVKRHTCLNMIKSAFRKFAMHYFTDIAYKEIITLFMILHSVRQASRMWR